MALTLQHGVQLHLHVFLAMQDSVLPLRVCGVLFRHGCARKRESRVHLITMHWRLRTLHLHGLHGACAQRLLGEEWLLWALRRLHFQNLCLSLY